MQNPRKYGNPPYALALIHGGPGAAGEMKPVAEELSQDFGVLEPLQTKNTITEQIEELKIALEKHAALPVTLIGHSWGAWLAMMVTAQYPRLVKKLILVSSAGFQTDSGLRTQECRYKRMSQEHKLTLMSLTHDLRDPDQPDQNAVFKQLGDLFSQIDAYDLSETPIDPIIYQYDIYQAIWPEADALRQSGELLAYAANVTCPVVAIHGDHDPHLAEHVKTPLTAAIKGFRLEIVEKCGHRPWQEKQAHGTFYNVLKAELDN